MNTPIVYVDHAIKWEYKIVVKPSLEMLNELGGDGWELAGILLVEDGAEFYFKRELA